MAPVTESVLKQAKGRYLERPIRRRLSFRATRFANALTGLFPITCDPYREASLGSPHFET